MLHALVIGMAILALIGGGPWNTRLAMISFAVIYGAGSLLFRGLEVRKALGDESYLLIAAILSYAQVVFYCRLRPTAGILAAACCEVVLLAIMLLSCLQIDILVPLRVALWRSANTVAVGLLLWSWGNGRMVEFHAGDSAGMRKRGHWYNAAARRLSGVEKGAGAVEKAA